MTDLEHAKEAIARAGETGREIAHQAGLVDRVVGSLSQQLERNGFSIRIARLYGLDDQRP